MASKAPMSVKVPEALVSDLRALAHNADRTLSQEARRALKQYVEESKRALLSGVGSPDDRPQP